MRRSGKFYLAVLMVFALCYATTGQGPNRACTDNDGDGFAVEGDSWGNLCGPIDCDDSNPDVNPDAFEGYIGDPTCSDGVDDDCDGVTDDADWGCLPWEAVSILVRADPLFPGELDGLVGGDPVAGAEIEIIRNETGEVVASGLTNGNGELLLEVPGIGPYSFFGTADTVDPYCWWSGGLEIVVVETEPLEVIVDVWLICA